MRTSQAGKEFIAGHEGVVKTAYLDPVGVPTIGAGATNASKSVTQYLANVGIPGGKIVPGVTKISERQAIDLLDIALRDEYEPYVTIDALQHQFDAAVSAVYNLGPKFMTWQAVSLWKKGRLVEAAMYWRTHYNTAAGKKLPGLVRRRIEEGDIFEFARYPQGVTAARVETAAPPAIPDPVVKEAQEVLVKKGFDIGTAGADGWMGPKTRAAIETYQRQHPHLTVDGKLGPATLSQLQRDALAVRDAVQKTLPTVTAVGGASWLTGLPWAWIAAGVAVVAVGYFAWRYRDVVMQRWAAARGVK